MEIIDTHCHLYSEYFSDIDEIIKQSNKLNVIKFINNACDKSSCIEVLRSVEKYNSIYGAIGIHPEYVQDYKEDDIKFIEQHVNDKRIVAIGEIGLDYYYTKENKVEQKRLLEEQLKIAEEYNKPVIIHNREATQDIIDILKKYKVKGIIHAFNGSLETANIFIKMGFLLGIGGVITFKNCNLKDIVEKIDVKNLVFETDAPYLAPVPYRGKQNIPGYTCYTLEFVANLKNMEPEQLAIIANENLKRIFDI